MWRLVFIEQWFVWGEEALIPGIQTPFHAFNKKIRYLDILEGNGPVCQVETSPEILSGTEPT
jgi:hypothetical protein